ncbi:MAG: phosphoribosylaminoimidazolesuccinocarboxamide synthase [Coriobacteriales bacterium]|nr:phosphoribosylaminoimidazolesuccinocarboxamide synthase [Coriobacteriales bacterium]
MALDQLRPSSQGKVRDLYDLGDKLLMVASDRISAFDYILGDEIPYKGEVLTRISLFWLDFLKDIIPNHLISADAADLPEEFVPYKDYLRGRFMLVKKAEMVPLECIVRGYLAGSGLKEYQQSGTVCGHVLPEGLVNSSKLAEPIFTPSTKAEVGDHDENISFERACDLVGTEMATQVRDKAIALYLAASEHSAKNGVIIADTKFEFGIIDGQLALCDEVLTPDSSRFWPADAYEPGKSQNSFDKQYVRDWLKANWDMQGNPPKLPAEVIAKTTEKYQHAYELITGTAFVPAAQLA